MAVIIVQWEAKEVLSQMNYRMSKSSLPVQVLPRALVGSDTSPFLSEFAAWLLCDYFTGLCLKLALPFGHLCLLSKLSSLGLHVLDETKAETSTVVLLEWCPKPETKLLCFGAASVSGGRGDGGKQKWEEKNQRWEAQKVNALVQQAGPGRGSGRKGFADAAFLCSYLPLWQPRLGSLGTDPKL